MLFSVPISRFGGFKVLLFCLKSIRLVIVAINGNNLAGIIKGLRSKLLG